MSIIDEAIVDAESAWLTDAQILNGNSALDNITTDLALPTLGENGSNITWYSECPNVVSAERKVTRSSFTVGSKTVTITAIITMGSDTFARKTFVLTVKPLDITDREVVFLDEQWLYRYNILDLNPSANSVTRNLSKPVSGPNNSSIIWESDTPSVISNDGTVTRPEHGEGHKSVKVTATLTKGESQTKRTFTYVVLEKNDTTAPEVVSTTLVYELKLLQEGQFIYSERISVELFKDGIRQRAFNAISAQCGEDVYKFTFTPQYGDHGIYELEFTYKGIGYNQVIRVPVNVISGKLAIAEEFKFRLYDVDTAGYYEAPESSKETEISSPR